MKSNNTGPLPYKPGKPPRDPFIQAIIDNPHPFIMVSAGVVGMIAMMIFAGSGSSSSSNKGEPPQPPDAEQTATVFAMTEPVVEPAIETIAQPDSQPTADPAPAADKLYITLIIDDIGNSQSLGARAVALPGAVTYAVLPHTPYGAELAEQAHLLNKEVMLHAPMSNLAQMPLGPGGLTDQLTRDDFMITLEAAIAAVPHLQGVNNHMGSALTGQETQMQWVMEALQKHDLYFVDSLTTAGSVAGRIAREQAIPTITRNVFLDNVATPGNIDREFQRLLQIARENGSAVGIGHPYKETLDYLEIALPTLAALNIELIPASAMIELQKTPGTAAGTTAGTTAEVMTGAAPATDAL